MLIDTNQLIETISLELSYRAVEDIPNPETIRNILQILEDSGYKIVPSHISVDISSIGDFENTVARWCSKDNVEPEDINGAQVLYSLASSGWLILPPLK